MKCEDVSYELIAYVDGRVKPDVRRGIEDHLAACAECRTRAQEFRSVFSVLDQAPAIEPLFGFDARLRARMASESRRPRFFSFVPQPRLALSMALLAVLTVLIIKLPLQNPVTQSATPTVQQEDFNAIENLGVLENYDVVTKFSALSELVPAQANDSQPQTQPVGRDGGGA